MRGLLVLLFVLVVFGMSAAIARAETYYNDSDVIGVEGSVPPEPEEEPVEGGETGEGAGGGGEGEGEGGGETEESGSGSGGSGAGGSGGSGGSGSGGSGSSGGGGSEEETIEDVLDELISSGALSGIGEGSVGSSGGTPLSGLGSGTRGVISIVGERVREVLRDRADLRDLLDSWRTLRGGGDGSANEYGLVAASTALADENVQAILFTANRFDITYRSRGYLLSIIPWTFPVRVAVIPQAPAGSRVTIALPWYRFFVREFFTPQRLAADIDGAIGAAAASAAAAPDEQLFIFELVARELRARVGTVGDSILLGTQ